MSKLKNLVVGATAAVPISAIRLMEADKSLWLHKDTQLSAGARRDDYSMVSVTRTPTGLTAVRSEQNRIVGRKLASHCRPRREGYLSLAITYM